MKFPASVIRSFALFAAAITFCRTQPVAAESIRMRCDPLPNPLTKGWTQIGDFIVMYPIKPVPLTFEIDEGRIVERHADGSSFFGSDQYTIEYAIIASQISGSRIQWFVRQQSSKILSTPFLQIITYAASSGRLTMTHMGVVDDIPERHARDAVSIVQFDCK
jgi:hypothetical protein